MAESLDSAVGPNDGIRGQIVQTSPGKYKAPKNIIPNIMAAKAIYWKYRQEHIKRIDLYAQIEGLIAGNPPYNPVELNKFGLSHIANFNNLDARSLYERGALAYWNLLNEAETICKFNLRIDAPEAQEWADAMSKNWDKVVRQWDAFYTMVNTMSAQIIKFGYSPVIWPDERDWRWRTVEVSRFFVTDQAQSDISQLTAVAVETEFTVQYLWEVYNEFKDRPNDTDWNVEQLGRFLVNRANSFTNVNTDVVNPMDLQVRLQNGDLGWDALFTDSVRLVSLLYKEYDGKVSHYIFDKYWDGTDFLFFADRQYNKITDALVIFTASPGEMTIHSNKGLGHKIFSTCQATMQLDCSIVDMGRWASTLLIRSVATGSRDAEPIRFTPGSPTHIGTAELQQNQLGANIGELVGASQYLLGKMQYNTANSGDDPGSPDANQGSIAPSEARARSFKEFGVLKHNIAHFYAQFDKVIVNMVSKMIYAKPADPGYEYVREWKELCIEDGVPEEIFVNTAKKNIWGLPRNIEVHATRVAGDGSTLARIMGLQELAIISSGFGPREEREYKRQWIMATLGQEYVPVFMQESDDADSGAGGASLAGLENNDMATGQSPVFSMDNDHRAHIATHMALANNTIQQIQQQQMNVIQAQQIFDILVPHTQEHVQALSQNQFAQNFMAGIEKPWRQIVDYAELNKKNAARMYQAELEKRKQAEENQQKVMSEQELKQFVAQNDATLAQKKTDATIARADEASRQRGEIQKDTARRTAENKRLEITLKHSNMPNKSIDEIPTDEIRDSIRKINGETPAPYDIEVPTV